MTTTLTPDAIKELAEQNKRNSEAIGQLTTSVKALTDRLGRTPAAGTPSVHEAFGGQAPHARVGEDPFTSRGFSFMKMLGAILDPTLLPQAKVEVDFHSRLHQIYNTKAGSADRYAYAGGHVPGEKSFLAPLSTAFMQDDMVPRDFRKEMRACVSAGLEGVDYDEMRWIRRKMIKSHFGDRLGYGSKTLSWLTETLGGSLVAPPEVGELIELLRNREALVNAGARTVPLPAQGRLKYPRQTAASSTYWVGENAPIQDSNIGTGDITLQAKKLAVLIKAPNELIRFASPAAEALMRDDMTKSLALGLDLAGLEGSGSDTQPRGILNFPGLTRIDSSSPRASPAGDLLNGRDFYRMIAAVEEGNAEFESFVMRPKTLYRTFGLRTDAVAQGDGQGPFLFNLIREATAEAPATIGGYPVVKSTQVSQVRSKVAGTAGNLTYILGGMWSTLLIGMFGAIEFSATTMGDQAFTRDQTWVKGILSADIQAMYQFAFVLLDNLDVTL